MSAQGERETHDGAVGLEGQDAGVGSLLEPRPPVRRYEHGSRVPGWPQEFDLTKPPATVPDPALTPVPEELRAAIEAEMAKYPNPTSASLPALHLAQRHHGWCSPEAIRQVACVMRLTPAYLTSVASFYDMFKLEPKPRHDVFVCTNITCSLLGGDEFYAAMLAAAEGSADVYVREFECLGACDIGPMASVDGEYVGPLNIEDAARIVADLEAGRTVLDHKQLRHRACADPKAAIADAGEGSSEGSVG
jgi:NADH:ubiquinone oxidoreductase subunit E